jgi:RNA polymerase sigma factor (sigma-70 family)
MESHLRSSFAAVGFPVTPSAKTFRFKVGLPLASTEEPATELPRLAVVEDEERVREALVFQLSSAGFEVMCFASAQDLLGCDPIEFDCIVSDIFLPGINGLNLQEQLIGDGKFASIVFITGRGDLAVGVQAMRRGAVDVLEKPVSEQALLEAVARGVERTRAEREQHARRTELDVRFRSLPRRQREVFSLITAGLLNKQVAAELGITERTVKVHRERLRRHMGADSLAELSRMAEILGIPSFSGAAGAL